MNEEYLWNRSGRDREIEELERLLKPFRFNDKRPVGVRWIAPLAIAASLLLCFIVFPRHRDSPWSLTQGDAAPKRLRSGEVVETGPSGKVRIDSAAIGAIEVDPDSRLRVSPSLHGEHGFDLEHGIIHAYIWAPPGQFVVGTPSAKAIDLGCQYTLSVAPDGSGRLTVEIGWVAFQWRDAESFIPAGAGCAMRPGKGPGTPYFLNASASLLQAIDRFDSAGDDRSLDAILDSVHSGDGLTLWHLLERTQGKRRASVFDRFIAVNSLPAQVEKAAILRGDPAAFDAVWNSLGLGDASFWRQWKRRLP